MHLQGSGTLGPEGGPIPNILDSVLTIANNTNAGKNRQHDPLKWDRYMSLDAAGENQGEDHHG